MNPNAIAASTVRRCQKSRLRIGALTAKFSLAAVLGIGLTLVSSELCRIATIRCAVDNAVYEAARFGILPGATADEVKARASERLSKIGLTHACINVSPTPITETTAALSVDITVPIERRMLGISLFLQETHIQRSLTLPREPVM